MSVVRTSTSELFERIGVWNFYDEKGEQSEDGKAVEYIYTYICEYIIEQYNKGIGSFEFAIPDELLFIGNRKLRKLVISYSQSYKLNDRMWLENKLNEDKSKMFINVPLDDESFKMECLHELKHLWYVSFSKNNFIDYALRKDHYGDVLLDRYTNVLSDFIYRMNPNEFEAYKEQMYKISYDMGYTGKKFNDMKDTILKRLSLDDKKLTEINNILDNPSDSVKRYILYLFLANMRDINPKNGYHLFSYKLYENPAIIDELDNIRYAIEKYGSRGGQEEIQDVMKEYSNEAFFDILVKSVKKNLDGYIKDYKKEIVNVIYTGWKDGETYKKEITYYNKHYNLYNYILLYKNGEKGIVVVLRDKKSGKQLIGVAKGMDLRDIFIDIEYNKEYYKDDYKVFYLFDDYLSNVAKSYTDCDVYRNMLKKLEEIQSKQD